MIRWPGHIKAGEMSNKIVSGLDWFPTLLAAAGDPNIRDKLLKGYGAAGKTFKVHLDGYNQLSYLTGQQPQSARNNFFYFNDDGDLVALRYDNWKDRVRGAAIAGHSGCLVRAIHQASRGQVVRSTRRSLRAGGHYFQHLLRLAFGSRLHLIRDPSPGRQIPRTFKDFPPSQPPGSFTIDQAMEKLKQNLGD
jgi:hypothetical protein